MKYPINRYAVCAVIPALSITAVAQNLFSNGSFENGTFSSSPINFAAQNASVVGYSGSGTTNSSSWSLSNWTFSPVNNNGQVERWINDSDTTIRAQDGNRYVYLSSNQSQSAPYSNPNAALARLSYNGGYTFQGGMTYTFSFSAADAGSTDGATDIKPQVGIQIGDVGSFVYSQFVNVNINAAWSDTAETAIPWQTYTFTWTPTQTYNNVPFYLAVAQNPAEHNKGFAAVVIDNFVAVPETETVAAGIFAAGVAGASWYRGRRRAVAKA